MTMEELDKHIKAILENAIVRLKEAYENRKEPSPDVKREECFMVNNDMRCRLVFPIKRDKETRISEQELRFAFVEAFNEYCNEKELPYFYSVETPTRDAYSGFSKKKKPRQNNTGQSGNIDLVIYDKNGNRICLIEFKAHNADKKEYLKDFVKLDNPTENENDNVKRYFIDIFKSVDTSTLKSLEKKVENTKEYISTGKANYKGKAGKTSFYYFALEGEPQEPEKLKF